MECAYRIPSYFRVRSDWRRQHLCFVLGCTQSIAKHTVARRGLTESHRPSVYYFNFKFFGSYTHMTARIMDVCQTRVRKECQGTREGHEVIYLSWQSTRPQIEIRAHNLSVICLPLAVFVFPLLRRTSFSCATSCRWRS